jgi:hypothetical protein
MAEQNSNKSNYVRHCTFVSRQSASCYSLIPLQIARDAIQSNENTVEIKCPLTLSTPLDNDNYFDWLFIPVGNNLHHSYRISGNSGILEYFKLAGNNAVVRDPQRVFPNIKHMYTRLIRQSGLSDATKRLKAGEITPEFRQQIFDDTMILWKNINLLENEQKPEKDALIIERGLLIGIDMFEKNNILFNNLDTTLSDEILRKYNWKKGAFLIRNSSTTNVNGSGDCTVFSITYVYEKLGSLTTNNRRYVSVHGVGLYDGCEVNHRLLNNSDMKEILADLQYKPAEYACLTDDLYRLHRIGVINLSELVTYKDVSIHENN